MAGWVGGQVDGWAGGWVDGWVGGQVGWAEGRALPHSRTPTDRCGRSGRKSPFYNQHSEELFSKDHLLMINVRGGFDEEQVSERLPQMAYELKRKTYSL